MRCKHRRCTTNQVLAQIATKLACLIQAKDVTELELRQVSTQLDRILVEHVRVGLQRHPLLVGGSHGGLEHRGGAHVGGWGERWRRRGGGGGSGVGKMIGAGCTLSMTSIMLREPPLRRPGLTAPRWSSGVASLSPLAAACKSLDSETRQAVF